MRRKYCNPSLSESAKEQRIGTILNIKKQLLIGRVE